MNLSELADLLRWNWPRIPTGAKIAVIALCVVAALGWLTAIRRLLLCLRRRRPDAPRSRFSKYLFVLLVALLPGGLLGTAAVTMIMGKKQWRRDAILIFGLSLLPGWTLAWMCAVDFPFPELAGNIFVHGTLGISFAVLQLWAGIKLLREGWGEPVENVPWWPPLAVWLELVMLAELIVLFWLARQ